MAASSSHSARTRTRPHSRGSKRAPTAPVARASDEAPDSAETWRIVQYDSSRGLEGCICVCIGLDQLAATKRKHPNFGSGEAGSLEAVVARWLMIAVSRAVQTCIITLADPQDPLVRTLRAAAARLPDGVVEWTTTGAWEAVAAV